MATPVTIPLISIGMEQATLLRWLKRVEETVAQGEALFELETDKSVVEVTAPHGGTLLAILAPGGTVRVGQVVGWIGAPGEHIPLPAEGVADTTAVSPRDMASGAPAPAPGPPASTAAFATPAARRRAQELNLDIRSVTGTGPGGRITQEDVERQASRPT